MRQPLPTVQSTNLQDAGGCILCCTALQVVENWSRDRISNEPVYRMIATISSIINPASSHLVLTSSGRSSRQKVSLPSLITTLKMCLLWSISTSPVCPSYIALHSFLSHEEAVFKGHSQNHDISLLDVSLLHQSSNCPWSHGTPDWHF